MKPREPRRTVIIAARIRWGGAWASATIRNISSGGMMMAADPAPPPGTYVEVHVGRITIVARVVWTMGQSFGLVAQSRIDVPALCGERRQDARREAEPPVRASARPLPSDQAERAKRLSSTIQFAALGIAGLAAASSLSVGIYQTLSNPLGEIGAHL